MPRALRLLASLLLATLALGGTSWAIAADHFVSASVSSFDGSSVNPGDTVTLAAGGRGPLTIANLKGTAARRIVVRNDVAGSGPTIVRRTSGDAGGFVFHCRHCEHVEIDGSGKWVGAPGGNTYGIVVTMTGGGSPSVFVALTGSSKFMTIRNVEVDGKWPAIADNGIGITVNDQDYNAPDHPGEWREGFLIERNYVHDVEGECLYIGPNWGGGSNEANGDDLRLRDIEIRRNVIEDCGWDGIQLKSAIEGANSIHHNTLERVGMRTDQDAGQHFGISIFEGQGKIYGNWIHTSGESGIHCYSMNLPSAYGPLDCEVYNNVVIGAGATGPLRGDGITAGRQDGDDADLSPRIYNNTIVRSEGVGILVGGNVTGSGSIHNNMLVDSGGQAIAVPSHITRSSNFEGGMSSAGFVNGTALDFRLTETSKARNAGSLSIYPADDFEGVSRPREGMPDQGAFEFVLDEAADAKPNPPTLVQIQ